MSDSAIPPQVTPAALTQSDAPGAPPPTSQPTPPRPGGGLAILTLVAGIAAVVFGLVPGLSFAAWLPALAAIVLGIVGLARKLPRRGFHLAGVILGPVGWLIAIIVSVAFIVSLGGSARAPGAAPINEQRETSAATAPTASPTPTPTPEPPAPVEPVVYSGAGDSVIQIELPDGPDSVAAATVTHDGSRNVAIWSLDANLEQTDLLVNEIGPYSGTVAFNLYSGSVATALEITADGAWTVTLVPLSTLSRFGSEGASGTGDSVLVYDGRVAVATLTHNGSSNFAVWSHASSSDLVVNEIGSYSGTNRWQAGPALIVITADGAWSIGF